VDKPVVVIPRQVRRQEDMSPDGTLTLHLQQDGDVVVIVNGYDTHGERSMVSVEFCAGGGGGMSPRTVEALKLLMAAMQADNDAGPFARDYERRYRFDLREQDRDFSR